ncbi:MAG: hypothetical protein AAGD43_06825 [Pseudomonadota bacterium]
MALDTFSDLQASVQSWAVRKDTKFNAEFPNFVFLAERRIYHGGDTVTPSDPLRAKVQDVRTTLDFADGEAELPDDVLDVRKLHRETDKNGLNYIDPQEFEELDAAFQAGGSPRVYTVEGSTVRLAPTFTGTLRLGYWKEFPPITETAPTHDLLKAHPEVWFEGILYHAFSWMQMAQLAQAHFSLFKAAIEGANRTRRAIQQPTQLRMRPARRII